MANLYNEYNKPMRFDGDIIITGRGFTQIDIMNKIGQIVASKNITVY